MSDDQTKQMATKPRTKEVHVTMDSVLCRVPCHPNPTTPFPLTKAQHNCTGLERRKETTKRNWKKEKSSKASKRRQAEARPPPLPLFLPSQFTQDSLARQLFPLVPPPFRSDPSLSPKASSFFNCLVTSGIKEYVLALCMIDSLIHPSILFPWHFAAPGVCAWPLRGEDFGLFFSVLGGPNFGRDLRLKVPCFSGIGGSWCSLQVQGKNLETMRVPCDRFWLISRVVGIRMPL